MLRPRSEIWPRRWISPILGLIRPHYLLRFRSRNLHATCQTVTEASSVAPRVPTPLIVDDPNPPAGTWSHWLLYNLPPSAHELPEHQPRTAELANGALQGKNDFGKVGYNGPCPPPGKPHRYFFRLYALDTKLDLKSGADRRTLDQAIKGHVIGEGELVGTFGR